MSYTMEPWEASATIDAETADRRRQLQNDGSELEPLERVTLLQVFRESCAIWYSLGGVGRCWVAHKQVYAALRNKYEMAALLRRLPQINAILDAAEAEVRAAAGEGEVRND